MLTVAAPPPPRPPCEHAADVSQKASPEDAAAVPQKERLKELYLYSVSEAYLQLRHKIGVAIDD